MRLRRRSVLAALATLTLLVPGTAAVAQASGPVTTVSSLAAEAPVPPTTLPLVSVALTDPDPTKNTLDYLHASKDNSVKATVNLVDGSNAANDIVDASATIKGRGNHTWTLDKRPYQIKFTTAVGPLGMQTSRTWVLLANHQDPSLLRNKISYDLANAFGLQYSPESRFVDLTINGEYLGNYLLVEKTEVGTNRIEPHRRPRRAPRASTTSTGPRSRTTSSPTGPRRSSCSRTPPSASTTCSTPRSPSPTRRSRPTSTRSRRRLYAPSPDWQKITAHRRRLVRQVLLHPRA